MTESLRIVSLIASATEIVCALGLRERLVGRSHECDFPQDVRELPQCTSPKFLPDGTSYEIDQRVKAVLQESLSVYRVDAQLLDSLEPTHIITQSQCEVCAVSLKDVEAAACELIRSRPQIISLEPNQLADVWRDIAVVANALGIEEKGRSLINQLQGRLQALRDATANIKNKIKVAYIEWIDPLMAGGNWMPELIEIAGGINLFGITGKHSPPLNWDAFIASQPDVIVVAPCGFDIQRTMEELHVLQRALQCSAPTTDRIYVADGNQYFNRPGPRLVESVEILAEIFYPDLFDYGHEGKGWVGTTGGTVPDKRA